MNDTIIGSVLKTLRKRQGLSQAELAEKTGLSKDTLSRLENGKQSGTALRTRRTLAKCLGVEPEVLTGEKPIPIEGEAAADSWDGGRRFQVNRVNGAVRNAFSLVAMHYRIPVGRIVDLAPLLFVLTAERSLDQRRTRLASLADALDRADAAAAGFHHLPRTIAPGFEAEDDMAAEGASIDDADILAERIDDKLYLNFGPQKEDYDSERDNPFVVSLKEAATDPARATIDSFSRDETDFEVLRDDAMKLAGGNADLAEGILQGWAPLHEMPRELLKGGAVDGRIAWLQVKAAEHAAAMSEMLAALGFDDLDAGSGS